MRRSRFIPFAGLGLALALALGVSSPDAARAQAVALTFDDLPAHGELPPGETQLGVIARLVAAMADAGVPPSHGFVNAADLEDDPSLRAVLNVWRAAGHPLANHGWSHAGLDAVGTTVFTEEIVRNESLLQTMAGDTDWRWFRYPFLNEGSDPAVRDTIRAVLAKRGYKVASVTQDFGDWAWNPPYARCRAMGDDAAVEGLEASYLAAAERAFLASKAASHAIADRDIPQVLLLHSGAFDAHMMPRLLAMYRRLGATFVTLETAMADPFYAADIAVTPGGEPLSFEAAARARGIALPARAPLPTDLDALCR